MLSTDFLIIAGAQKAGTTSLFNYFRNHPQINPCAVKEPCCFQSRRVRSRLLIDGYEGLKRAVRASGGNLWGLRPVLGRLRRRFEPGYYQLVTEAPGSVQPDDATLAMLREYYRADTHAMQKLLQRSLPWTPIIDGTASWTGSAEE